MKSFLAPTVSNAQSVRLSIHLLIHFTHCIAEGTLSCVCQVVGKMPATRSKTMMSTSANITTRMNLRSFRNVPLVPMETSSSSSDDSCDSFGSDGGFASTNIGLKLRQRKSPVQRPKVFESTSEEDTISGTEDNDINSQMRAMKVDSVIGPKRRGRRSRGLKVAMTFPTRKAGQKRPQPKESLISEAAENFMDKRASNIKENKAMLAKLMAELNKVPLPSLFPKRKSMGTPRTWRKKSVEPTYRPHTRSRSQVDGPPSPPPEEDPEDKFNLVRKSRYYEEVDEQSQPRRRSPHLTIPHVVRPVEEVTQAELDRICDNVKTKVYSQSTGTTCHQCRQKTIDTKTNCRNEECVGVRGQFCGPCLRNRYGEEVRDALLDPEWLCPPCRGICNCSFCRAREGRCATGVLVYLAKYHGYDNVHAYLKSLKKELEQGSE